MCQAEKVPGGHPHCLLLGIDERVGASCHRLLPWLGLRDRVVLIRLLGRLMVQIENPIDLPAVARCMFLQS